MSSTWDALGARARGLSTHLLGEERLRGLERAETVRELVRRLDPSPYTTFLPPHTADPKSVDVGITRSVADRMAVLSRWAGADPRLLAVVFLEQDIRNVRLVLRGIVGGVASDRRLSGTLPTPMLGRRALDTLAQADSPGSVAATLTVWGHPLGPPLLEEAGGTRPDLFRLEAALARALAAERAFAPHGGRHMTNFVRESLDTQNILTALLVSDTRAEGDPSDLFVDGGTALDRRTFAQAASAPSREQCADLLSRGARRTLFRGPLRESPTTPTAVSRRILQARIDRIRDSSLSEPISPLPVLLFLLRLRQEVASIRRSLWRASLQQEPTP